jgi:class 3 adenylate cyclase
LTASLGRLQIGPGPPITEKRKLAATLAADVVGYSRLAGADEERTLARLRALRSDLIVPTIAVHHGRVVKRTGDGVLTRGVSTKLIVEFEHALALDPSKTEVFAGLGNTYGAMGKYERAIEFIDKAIRLSPRDPSLFF